MYVFRAKCEYKFSEVFVSDHDHALGSAEYRAEFIESKEHRAECTILECKSERCEFVGTADAIADHHHCQTGSCDTFGTAAEMALHIHCREASCDFISDGRDTIAVHMKKKHVDELDGTCKELDGAVTTVQKYASDHGYTISHRNEVFRQLITDMKKLNELAKALIGSSFIHSFMHSLFVRSTH